MNPQIERLSAEDQLMLEADELWPQDVGAIAILDGDVLLDAGGELCIDAVREAIGSKLHRVPRFRQVIRIPPRGLGGPVWVDAPDFELSRHVQVLPLPPGSDDAELLRAAERLRRQRLDPRRPLWEMWFLPGLRGRRVGLFVRMHHAIGDGRAAMSMLGAILDTAAQVEVVSPPAWKPARPPSRAELLADRLQRHLRGVARALKVLARPRATLRRVRDALPGVREILAEEPASETSIDRIVGPERSLALVRSSLRSVRSIGRTCDASVNDVLLAAIAGGLRVLLQSRGEPVEGVTLGVYVPVSLRGRLRGPVQGNEISQMAVPLRLEADPGRRLRGIAAETAVRKERVRMPLGTLFGIGIVRRLLLKVIVRQRVNVASASIPGPRRPLYLAGARMLELYPVLNLLGNQPLGVGALSYAGTFSIAVVADRNAFPDIEVLAAGMRAELDALCSKAGPGRTYEHAVMTA